MSAKYDVTLDRQLAYEILSKRAEAATIEVAKAEEKQKKKKPNQPCANSVLDDGLKAHLSHVQHPANTHTQK